MYKLVGPIGGAIFLLASCTDYQEAEIRSSSGFIKVLPEAVSTIAAPYQDLTAVKLDPKDGCYVYRHEGPVETTFLPLRSVRGRPICTRPAKVETASSQAG